MRKLILLLLNIISISHGFSQWNSNPTINNLVANTSEFDTGPFCVTDGSNGSIIVFTSAGNILAQRITSTGILVWGATSSPVVICNAASQQYFDYAIADGLGGAFIVWEDYRHDPNLGEIYIQHINSGGVSLWPANGIRVTTTSNNDDYGASLCSDGNGGVILAWYWDNYTSNTQVVAQRYNSAGVEQWAANGVQVCNAPGFRALSSIVTDGAGGALVFFIDTRDDPNGTNYDYVDNNTLVNINIYAQRLNGNGLAMWANDGVVVCGALGNQGLDESNTTVIDGGGGAIIVFDDSRNDVPVNGHATNDDIYAQKLNSNGLVQWGTNGIPVTSAAGNQYIGAVVGDGNGGAVASWDNEADSLIYSQKINSAGAVNWVVNGIAISPISTKSNGASLVADGAGNYIYCFDNKSGNSTRLLSQKVNAAGALQWGLNSVPVCNNPAGSLFYAAIVLSDAGGAILSWSDNRNNVSTGMDIFASKVLSGGILAGSNIGSGFITSSNGNWNDPATWLGGVVPPANALVIVRHNVTVTANATCYSLKVELPAGNLVIVSGINLTITN